MKFTNIVFSYRAELKRFIRSIKGMYKVNAIKYWWKMVCKENPENFNSNRVFLLEEELSAREEIARLLGTGVDYSSIDDELFKKSGL